jgi:hypothetical protein
MSDIIKVSFTRTYNLSSDVVEIKKLSNETNEMCAERLALAELEHDFIMGFIEPNQDDFIIKIEN